MQQEKDKVFLLEKDIERLKIQIIDEKSRTSETMHELSLKSSSHYELMRREFASEIDNLKAQIKDKTKEAEEYEKQMNLLI